MKDATRDIARVPQESEAHDGKLGGAERLVDIRLKLDLRPEEWTEFMRRLRALYDYVQVVSESRSQRAAETGGMRQYDDLSEREVVAFVAAG